MSCLFISVIKLLCNLWIESINATIVHDCYYFNEKFTNSQTNPLTMMYYFNTPATNIVVMPAITHHFHDISYSNLADECFFNELTQENTTDSEININNVLKLINKPDHVDYSTLGHM